VGFTTGVAVVVATLAAEVVVELVVDEAGAAPELEHCPACFKVVPASQQYALGE